MSLASRTPPTPEEYKEWRETLSNWGRWGDDDQLGTLNFITDETRQAAASLVREGRTVSLSRPFATAAADPSRLNSAPAEHRMTLHGRVACTDYIGVSYHGYVNTHIDALCHVYGAKDVMYNGRPISEVTEEGARSNSIEHWRDGIVTRGVLYDVARHRGVSHVSVEEPVHGWELQDVAKAQGIEPHAGDAVLIRSGRKAFEEANPDHANVFAMPGNHASIIEFLHLTDASLLGWDLMEAAGQEEYGTPIGPIHCFVIPYMGLAILDNADFEGLSEICAKLNRWEFQLIIAPLVVIGGTGSPSNPIAVF